MSPGYNGPVARARIMTEPVAAIVDAAPADAARDSWVNHAPRAFRPYLQLSRFDRPIGFWLLVLPCLIGVAYARIGYGFDNHDAVLVALFGLGSIAMRGAGCTYNDILDRKIDAQVARTALRPLASGAVTVKAAWIWLLIQCLIGLGVLLTLPTFSQLVALGSIPLVALYPLMKRITWWPQMWLGLTFNWGVLVAVAALKGEFGAADYILYAALVFWTLGYDTIYALQDREDDALIGVRSTARRFGAHVRAAIMLIYAICAGLTVVAGAMAADWRGILAAAPFAFHLAMQAMRVEAKAGRLALRLFRANRDAGILLFAGWAFIAALI
jgi:4-hydroxybenzoate polyprenyltransferase